MRDPTVDWVKTKEISTVPEKERKPEGNLSYDDNTHADIL